MPALGGEAKRLTYQGSNVSITGWDTDGKHILYSSAAGLAFDPWIWKVNSEGGEPQRLSYGPANHIDFSDAGGVILGRLTREPRTLETLPRRYCRTTLDRHRRGRAISTAQAC